MLRRLDTIGRSFRIVEKIDEGAFAEIYSAFDTKTSRQLVVKMEPVESDHPMLLQEFKLYKYLHSDPTVADKGIPNIYHFSNEGSHCVLVMDLLGASLEDLLHQSHHKFTLKTVLMLMDQMIQRIEFLHSRGFLHRDIKPGNFCIGRYETSHKVFLLDFGLAKRYLKDGKHIPYREGKNLCGTARYTSLNSHLGVEKSRRDDLESLGYTAIYLLRGLLPWQKQNWKLASLQRSKQIKLTISIEELCKGLPAEFITFLKYVRELKFEQKPDYDFLRKIISDLFKKNGYMFDYNYDWVKLTDQEEQHKKDKESEASKFLQDKNIPIN